MPLASAVLAPIPCRAVLCCVWLQVFEDPSMMKTAAEMMKAMPPEQLKAAMAQAGQHLPPGMDLDPDQLSQMADMVAKMPPEQLKVMSEAARSQAGVLGSGSSAAAAGGSSAAAPRSSGRDVTPVAPAGVPAMGAGGMGMPAGMPDMSAMMTPEMMKMASEMMKNMTPADMAAMSQMAAGGGAGASPAGGWLMRQRMHCVIA